MSKRISQVNSLIKRELGKIFLEELEWSADTLVTITSVETSRDLREAKIWVSVLPLAKVKEVFGELAKKSKQLQKLLHQKLVMKPLPKLKFKFDTTEKEVEKIEELLEKIGSRD